MFALAKIKFSKKTRLDQWIDKQSMVSNQSIIDIPSLISHITCIILHYIIHHITDTHDRTAKVTRVMARQKMEMEQPTYPMVDSAARWPVVSCAKRPTAGITTQNERSLHWSWYFKLNPVEPWPLPWPHDTFKEASPIWTTVYLTII